MSVKTEVQLQEEVEQLRTRVAELEVTESQLEEARSRQQEAEQRLRTLLDYAPEAIVMLDAETGRFIDVNPSAEKLFGMPRKALVEMGPFELSPQSQPDGVPSGSAAAKRVGEALSGKTPVFEWWHINASGEQFPCEVRLVKMPWGDRNVIRGSITEISDQKQLELCEQGRSQVLERIARGESLDEVLHVLVKTIESLFPGMLCSVLVLDPETGCLRTGAGPSLPAFYNAAVNGLKIGPGVGSCGTAAFTGERVIVADLMTHPYWASFVSIVEKAKLRACWSEPILSLNGKVLGTFAMYFRAPRQPARAELEIIGIAAQLASVAIEHDVNKQMLQGLNESLERRVTTRTKDLATANTELERSNDELQQFAYVASHDLQEPLRMVTSFGTLLREELSDQLSQDANEWLGFVIEGGSRMQALVNDLLDYSRIDGQARPFQSVDLNSVLDEVMVSLRPSIDDTRSVITVDQLPNVVGDRPQIVQLLQNLISNGIKFHEKQPPQIRISGEQTDDGWLISVTDQGIGMAEEYSECIFDFFKRLHGRDRFPGTGIGLPICKRIVERHGGRIWAESSLNHGSTFSFILPIRDLH